MIPKLFGPKCTKATADQHNSDSQSKPNIS